MAQQTQLELEEWTQNKSFKAIEHCEAQSDPIHPIDVIISLPLCRHWHSTHTPIVLPLPPHVGGLQSGLPLELQCKNRGKQGSGGKVCYLDRAGKTGMALPAALSKQSPTKQWAGQNNQLLPYFQPPLNAQGTRSQHRSSEIGVMPLDHPITPPDSVSPCMAHHNGELGEGSVGKPSPTGLQQFDLHADEQFIVASPIT